MTVAFPVYGSVSKRVVESLYHSEWWTPLHPYVRHTVLPALIACHLHGQTIRSTVWANGTQNSGLVISSRNRVYYLYKSVFHFPKNDREGVKMVSKMTLKKWNTNFRLEHFVRKNRTTFSDVPLLSEICQWNDPTQKVVFHLTNRIFRKLFVNGKQLLFQNVILTLVSFVIAERNKGSRQISW